MKSPRTSIDKGFNRGFTLMEIIVVMSIVAILGGLGLYYGLDNLRGNYFHSDRDVLISALQHARARAINNICSGDCCTDGLPHGVYFGENDKFIIFQGENYTSTQCDNDIVMKANPNVKHEGASGINEIVFDQLSGEVENPGDITITDNITGKTSTISINSEGQILWTN